MANLLRFTVTVGGLLDVDAWMAEYGLDNPAEAAAMAVDDLQDPGWYLCDAKWNGLSDLEGVIVRFEYQPEDLAA